MLFYNNYTVCSDNEEEGFVDLYCNENLVAEIAERNRPMLLKYIEGLVSFSGRVRLTGPQDPETLWSEHIVDCLYSVPLLPPEGNIIDVGTGGGLPGVVWAICRPDLTITLLDSVRKKCKALEELIALLKLGNVRIVCSRAEEYALERREHFSLAGARAVTGTGVLLEYLSPFVSLGGKVLAFKGPLYKEEIEPLNGKEKRLGLSAPSVFPYSLNGKEHFLLIWQKKQLCSKEFPRKTGMAERKFWWR